VTVLLWRLSPRWPVANTRTPTDPEEAPDGAAVFPLIPPELGVHPLLLAVLHAYVFLEGSDTSIVHPAAAQEALEYLATYLQRLCGPDLLRVREDLQTLADFAKQEKWPKSQIQFLLDFLRANGVP
jgi:hypothetical protein